MSTSWFKYYFDRIRREFPRNVYRIVAANTHIMAVLGAGARVFEIFEDDSTEFETSLNPLTATGFWLDFWGYYFNETRFYDESDDQYRARMRASIIYGRNSERAIIEAVKPLLDKEPEILEPKGKILQNVAYTSFDYDTQYDGEAFTIILKYRPPTAGTSAWFIGYNYLGYNTYVYDVSGGRTTNVQMNRIKEIVARTKLAGVKVVHDIT